MQLLRLHAHFLHQRLVLLQQEPVLSFVILKQDLRFRYNLFQILLRLSLLVGCSASQQLRQVRRGPVRRSLAFALRRILGGLPGTRVALLIALLALVGKDALAVGRLRAALAGVVFVREVRVVDPVVLDAVGGVYSSEIGLKTFSASLAMIPVPSVEIEVVEGKSVHADILLAR